MAQAAPVDTDVNNDTNIVVPVVNKGGRPFNIRKYTPKDLQIKIDEYFNYCDSNPRVAVDKHGVIQQLPMPMTIGRLCIYLDVVYDTLQDYQKIDGYSLIVTRAKEKIAEDITYQALCGTVSERMAQWYLAVRHNLRADTNVNVNVTNNADLSQLSYEQLLALSGKTKQDNVIDVEYTDV